MTDTEHAAIGALRRGDVGGLEALVRLHQLRALRLAYSITGDRPAAEDVVANAFLTVYDRIQQFDQRRPFAPWFSRIVVNDALKVLRRWRSPITGGAPTWLDELTDPAPGPEEQAELHELQRTLLTAVAALSPPQRAALVLRYSAGMCEAEIAEITSSPLGTVKSRLRAAEQQLRRGVLREFGLNGGQDRWDQAARCTLSALEHL